MENSTVFFPCFIYNKSIRGNIFHPNMQYMENFLLINTVNGFKCLKIYLYLIYPGFPLGYFYAKKAFEYIEANSIEKFYKKSLKI